MIIWSVKDMQLLQSCLNEMTHWCIRNNFKINGDKCEILTFFRTQSKIPPRHYLLNGVFMNYIDSIKDINIRVSNKIKYRTILIQP